jgi:hypothetical protein
VQQVTLPPSIPPALKPLFVGQIPGGQVFTFETDLPVRQIPLGPATLHVIRARIDLGSGRVVREEVLSGVVHDVEESEEVPVPPGVTAAKRIFRGPPRKDGRVIFTVRIPTTDEANSTTVIALRDPLGRRVEREILGWV